MSMESASIRFYDSHLFNVFGEKNYDKKILVNWTKLQRRLSFISKVFLLFS